MNCEQCEHDGGQKTFSLCSGCVNNKTHQDNFEKVEPKVLTAEESLKIAYLVPLTKEGAYYHGFYNGEKNGQLKMDLEVKKAFKEAIKIYGTHPMQQVYEIVNRSLKSHE